MRGPAVIRASPWSTRPRSRRGSGSQATRSARPRALNAASARWWSLRPVPARCSVQPDGPRERLEGVLDELERQGADPLTAERQVDDGVRPAADVHDGRRERLVHRDRAVTEALDPGSIAKGLGEGGAQDERDVLGRVVLVDPQVAVGAHGEVEQAVVGERSQQVVVEADARVDRGVARSVEAERDGDLGLVRRPGQRDPAAVLARADRSSFPSGLVMRPSPRRWPSRRR